MMEIKDYYEKIFDKLQRGFEFSHYVLAYGNDLRLRDLAQGRKPRDENSLMVTVEPLDKLWDLAVNWGLEIFFPVVGYNSQAVLFSLDYEIYLEDARRLYANKEAQRHYFHKYIGPVTLFMAEELEKYKIPYEVDLTPSGGHFLSWVRESTVEWQALAQIGYLENDLRQAYNYHDEGDLKRNPLIKEEAGYVYSGIGRIWEYLARKAIQEIKVDGGELSLTLSNPANQCVNLDITAYGDPAYMRIMRAPFSVHKKRGKIIPEAEPLVDIILWYYDSFSRTGEAMDFQYLIECMWEREKAVRHGEKFSGHIPCANENLVNLVEDYKKSPLYRFHQAMDGTPDLPRQEAFQRARREGNLEERTQQVLNCPNPLAKDPKALAGFVRDFQRRGWKPKEIGNLIADLYEQPEGGWKGDDWFKYPSRTRGNFWARIYTEL